MKRWFLIGLLVLAAALFWFLNYHPALIAAPGYKLRNITEPDWLNGRIKTLQAIAEQTPCTYQLLGWQETDALYYESTCDGTRRIWRYTVANAVSEPVTSVPAGLYNEAVPAADIVVGVLANVRPRELATVSREVFIAGDALPAPDGRFTALVSRHVYGPQDVLLLSPGNSPSPTLQLAAATATAVTRINVDP